MQCHVIEASAAQRHRSAELERQDVKRTSSQQRDWAVEHSGREAKETRGLLKTEKSRH
jgi:hypothetical protein